LTVVERVSIETPGFLAGENKEHIRPGEDVVVLRTERKDG
jgi:hypothetical protein